MPGSTRSHSLTSVQQTSASLKNPAAGRCAGREQGKLLDDVHDEGVPLWKDESPLHEPERRPTDRAREDEDEDDVRVKDGERHPVVWVKDFLSHQSLEANMVLSDELHDYMVIATPFADN